MIQVQSTAPQLFEAWAHDILSTPLARRTDPATSHAAASNARHFAGSHCSRILQALKTHGPMSPAQLFDHTGLSVVQIDRRRKEMINAGHVRIQVGESGKPVTHAGCEVWELAPQK
jgi:hypothetical protein